MVAVRPLADERRIVRYHPRGGAVSLLECRDPEVLLEGPAGTGKTLSCLWKMHVAALKYPKMRGLMVRKTLVSLTASALVTFATQVLDIGNFGVKFFGGSKAEPAQFRYPNGSRIVVGGLDNAAKIMSTEYDLIYVNEATDLTLDDWEKLTARNRYGVMPYQQVIGDCNPDAPTHWLNTRCNEGTTTRLRSTHHDNPRYWDGKDWTAEGQSYVVEKLGKLTGVRRHRLLDGLWAAAEGIVYDGWNPAIHLVDKCAIGDDWPRYWVLDFGYVHPFVWQWWAVGPDGNAFRYREIYYTGRLVTDHAAQGMKLSSGEPRPVAIITDHDAEDRATFERATGLHTTPAFKEVSPGIQAVNTRLRVGDNGKAGLYFLRDARVERDSSLVDLGKPTCTEEEFPSYIWDIRPGVRKGEQPVKADDHGMDSTRYFVADLDQIGRKRGYWTA
jgi:PBSX family phage terminase large subunit